MRSSARIGKRDVDHFDLAARACSTSCAMLPSFSPISAGTSGMRWAGRSSKKPASFRPRCGISSILRASWNARSLTPTMAKLRVFSPLARNRRCRRGWPAGADQQCAGHQEPGDQNERIELDVRIVETVAHPRTATTIGSVRVHVPSAHHSRIRETPRQLRYMPVNSASSPKTITARRRTASWAAPVPTGRIGTPAPALPTARPHRSSDAGS